eukprot:743345-Prymnesium_polylepis.1
MHRGVALAVACPPPQLLLVDVALDVWLHAQHGSCDAPPRRERMPAAVLAVGVEQLAGRRHVAQRRRRPPAADSSPSDVAVAERVGRVCAVVEGAVGAHVQDDVAVDGAARGAHGLKEAVGRVPVFPAAGVSRELQRPAAQQRVDRSLEDAVDARRPADDKEGCWHLRGAHELDPGGQLSDARPRVRPSRPRALAARRAARWHHGAIRRGHLRRPGAGGPDAHGRRRACHGSPQNIRNPVQHWRPRA